MRISELDPEEVLAWMQECFDVDAERGILIWREPPRNHGRMRGKEAGTARISRGKNYIHVKKDKVAIKRGWLIFLWVYGRWPNECLDHIDGNSANDSRFNIREATVMQNSWNHKGRKRHVQQLPMGVRTTKGIRGYQARISCNKIQLHLGTFETVEAAQAAYSAKRKELYREFA